MDKTAVPKKAFSKLVLNETRLAWRIPTGLFAGLGLPLLLLIIFGSIPALSQHTRQLDGLSYFEISFPILLTLTVLSLSFIALPQRLVSYREQGILRRFSVTPPTPIWLLGAQVVVNLCMALVGLLILIVIGLTVFGVQAPKDIAGFLLALFLTITAFFAVGLWVAAIARNNGTSNAIGGILFYVMLFFSGIWIPREIMPAVLKNISDWTPAGASVGAVQNAIQGASIPLHLLLALGFYTLVFGYLAVRYFRWE
jgi:ABC-2 type transport system permease protein